MFIDVTSRRNPLLIRAAVLLHQRRIIPANTYVLDLDALADNTRLIRAEADRVGLSLYFMTKQINRNPVAAQTIAAAGIARAVAVEPAEARELAAAGIDIGHVGHLVEVAAGEMDEMVGLKPEVMTVFSVDKARQVGAAARRAGRTQAVLLRVAGPDDHFYPGQEGGIEEADLLTAAAAIAGLPGVRLTGVTSFPCLLYSSDERQPVATPNLATLARAAAALRQAGYPLTQVNAPSLTATGTIGMLAAAGATHGEPGHSLIGTTPWHAVSDQPERPALVYVTEVAHTFRGKAYTFGGGLYLRSRARTALTGRDPETLQRLPVADSDEFHIDYYGGLDMTAARPVAVGDTAVYALRAQAFAGRANLAVVAGLGRGRIDSVRLFDRANRELPVPPWKGGELL